MPPFSVMDKAGALNDDPFVEPAFLAGLEAAGYLQRLDTSEARITSRYQHALTKMKFAAHSEEFLTRMGVRKVHRSTVQFFNEEPVSDPFVHVLVGSLPSSRQSLITPRGCETSGWTPIECEDEADGTIHFTMSHPGFWPVTVVFDCNQQDVGREDKYAGIRGAADSDSEDPESYLSGRTARASGYASSAYAGYGAGTSISRARSSSRRRDSAGFYTGGMGGSQYGGSASGGAGRRQDSYRSAADSSSSSSDDGHGNGYGRTSGAGASGRRSSYARSSGGMGSRRGSMSAADIDDMASGGGHGGLGRSASRSSMRSNRY
ncbi:hypothetical protein BMF94_6848 [Rhodotorula taiwanensis]|uniref:Uncharacterized protein n=1 Tax=Rhodotorula taiwanensis TaxID=741276 RepID=A0A2S5B0F2_9BASI|nr:hypothetical protein BMF94_6848 [Rhodotorula taiwanensis]